MVTYLIVLAAVCLVVVAFQFCCLAAYQKTESEVTPPHNGCTQA